MAPAEIEVLLVRSPRAGEVEQRLVRIAPGSTAAQALQSCAWSLASGESLGLWGRRIKPHEVLRHGDRMEIYRSLTVDPMQARHRRHALQGRRVVSRHRPQPK